MNKLLSPVVLLPIGLALDTWLSALDRIVTA